jgi:hypothetical protein
LVTNQSVDAGTGMAGIRWYEIRTPNTTPTIFQQGTYAPGLADGVHRWMGSIAMDSGGNMGLGYSASDGTAVFPSVRFTGRLASDPPGTMPQGEAVIVAGTGSQTGSPRWGDYTSLNLDPADDCTFWYVNQYIPTTSAVGWRIRVGSFTFPPPSCIPTRVALQSFAVELSSKRDRGGRILRGRAGSFLPPIPSAARKRSCCRSCTFLPCRTHSSSCRRPCRS